MGGVVIVTDAAAVAAAAAAAGERVGEGRRGGGCPAIVDLVLAADAFAASMLAAAGVSFSKQSKHQWLPYSDPSGDGPRMPQMAWIHSLQLAHLCVDTGGPWGTWQYLSPTTHGMVGNGVAEVDDCNEGR